MLIPQAAARIDRERYEREMATYTPPEKERVFVSHTQGKSKSKKDPNHPKRPLSAFFCFLKVGEELLWGRGGAFVFSVLRDVPGSHTV